MIPIFLGKGFMYYPNCHSPPIASTKELKFSLGGLMMFALIHKPSGRNQQCDEFELYDKSATQKTDVPTPIIFQHTRSCRDPLINRMETVESLCSIRSVRKPWNWTSGSSNYLNLWRAWKMVHANLLLKCEHTKVTKPTSGETRTMAPNRSSRF